MIYFQDENGKVAKEAAQEHIDTVLDATRCPVMRVGNRASPRFLLLIQLHGLAKPESKAVVPIRYFLKKWFDALEAFGVQNLSGMRDRQQTWRTGGTWLRTC